MGLYHRDSILNKGGVPPLFLNSNFTYSFMLLSAYNVRIPFVFSLNPFPIAYFKGNCMPLSGQQGDFSLSADSLIRSTTKTQPAVDKPVIRADDVAFNVTVRPHFSDLVCTNPPYFALRDIQALGNNTITAKVITESGIENEIGIITGAEAGRHLAILGTCAYTRLDPAKKICLATDAEITFSDTHPTQPGPLTAIGTAFPIDSRNCWAKTTLSSASGVEICSLSVQYTLFSERTFLRLFSGHRVSGPIKGDSNPYVSCIYVEQLQA
ncbi:hypothetical protein EBR96_10270, partial [bacterium]|nr:hypothetical protein [bacterium]